MTSTRAVILTMLITFLAPACLVTGRATVRTRQPEMVMIDDGVYVIEDHDQPVFYRDNWYWRYDNGVWYRSDYYASGWVRYDSPPTYIVRIHNPHTYVRWRASGNARQRAKVRDHRQDKRQDRREDRREHKKEKKKDRPKVRDHR